MNEGFGAMTSKAQPYPFFEGLKITMLAYKSKLTNHDASLATMKLQNEERGNERFAIFNTFDFMC